jgi:hypothetical protein
VGYTNDGDLRAKEEQHGVSTQVGLSNFCHGAQLNIEHRLVEHLQENFAARPAFCSQEVLDHLPCAVWPTEAVHLLLLQRPLIEFLFMDTQSGLPHRLHLFNLINSASLLVGIGGGPFV